MGIYTTGIFFPYSLLRTRQRSITLKGHLSRCHTMGITLVRLSSRSLQSTRTKASIFILLESFTASDP